MSMPILYRNLIDNANLRDSYNEIFSGKPKDSIQRENDKVDALKRMNLEALMLTVCDDNLVALDQTKRAIIDYNRIVAIFRSNGIQLPVIYGIGIQKGIDVVPTLQALEKLVPGEKVAGQFKSANYPVLVLPPATLKEGLDIPSKYQIAHLQDLNLKGQIPGTQIISELDRVFYSSSNHLAFVMAWSTLAAVRGSNPLAVDSFYARNFSVYANPKEFNEDESVGPYALRDVFRAFTGQLTPVNLTVEKA